MAERTGIEWTATIHADGTVTPGATWNPVTGCAPISTGCDHCYARTLALRLQAMGVAKYANGFEVTLHPEALDQPRRWRQPRRVFVNSMSDLFHARVPIAFVDNVWDVMAECPQHTFQILTKRPERMANLTASLPVLPNVWLGTSVENADVLHRVGSLRRCRAAVRFLSCEPLLGPLTNLDLTGIGWVIAGGESGPGFRPPQVEWLRDLRDRCVAAGVPFLFKQWGGRTPKAGGRELDGRTWDEFPLVREGVAA